MVSVLAPDDIADGTDALGVGGDAPPGTYALLFELSDEREISVGALGPATFPAGAYAYVGSAFGSNGLGRVARHRRVAAGDHGVRHWHVDYLGGHPDASLVGAVVAPRTDVECGAAAAVGPATSPLSGFGSSNCDCEAHLAYCEDREALRSAIVDYLEGKQSRRSGRADAT